MPFHLSTLPFHPPPPSPCHQGMSCHTGSGSAADGLLLGIGIIAASMAFVGIVFLIMFISSKRKQREDRQAALARFEQEQMRLDEALQAAEIALSKADLESEDHRRSERKKKRIERQIARLHQSMEQRDPRVQ